LSAVVHQSDLAGFAGFDVAAGVLAGFDSVAFDSDLDSAFVGASELFVSDDELAEDSPFDSPLPSTLGATFASPLVR
jgi:hypothetical protein